MQPDTALVKVPDVEIVLGDRGAIWGAVVSLALVFIFWYVVIKGEEP